MNKYINNCLSSFSPATVTLWLIFLYNRATNFAGPYVAQAQKTVEAIRKSLHPDAILCFYEGIYVPVLYGNIIGSNSEYAEKPLWYYCDGTFYEKPEYFSGNTKRLSWLAADILCDGKKIADITDFVGKLRHTGELPPTPEYILGLWSYYNNLLLKRVHTQLVVIDSEAETHSFNFAATVRDDTSWLKSLRV